MDIHEYSYYLMKTNILINDNSIIHLLLIKLEPFFLAGEMLFRTRIYASSKTLSENIRLIKYKRGKFFIIIWDIAKKTQAYKNGINSCWWSLEEKLFIQEHVEQKKDTDLKV